MFGNSCALRGWRCGNTQDSGPLLRGMKSLQFSVLSIKHLGAACGTVLEYPPWSRLSVRALLQEAFNIILARLKCLLLHGKQLGFDK